MSDVTVDFLANNAPHQAGDRASLPRGRAAALIDAGVARLASDVAPETASVEPAPGRPAVRTAALRGGVRKRG